MPHTGQTCRTCLLRVVLTAALLLGACGTGGGRDEGAGPEPADAGSSTSVAAGALADLTPDASTADADITVKPFQSTVVRSCADPVPFADCPPDRIREWAPPAPTAVSCIDLGEATAPAAIDEATWHVSGEVGAFLTAAVLTYEGPDKANTANTANTVDEAVERARAAPDDCPPEPGGSGADLETWVESSSGPLHVVFGPRRVPPDIVDIMDPVGNLWGTGRWT